MSRRHEQDKVGDWKTVVAVILGFAGFIGVFLIGDIYPLHTRRFWVDVEQIGLVVLEFIFDIPGLGAIFVLAMFAFIAALFLGGLLKLYEEFRRQYR